MAKIKLVKKGPDSLAPATPQDVEMLETIKRGEWVEYEFKRMRNVAFHRKFFALLNLGYSYWEPTGGIIQLHEKEYLDGFIQFVASYTDHLDTLEELGVAYAKIVTDRRLTPTDAKKSREAFRSWVLIEAGFFDVYDLPDGTRRKVAQSISFAKMHEDTFREVYRAVFNVLWNVVLSTWFETEAEAENTVLQLLRFE